MCKLYHQYIFRLFKVRRSPPFCRIMLLLVPLHPQLFSGNSICQCQYRHCQSSIQRSPRTQVQKQVERAKSYWKYDSVRKVGEVDVTLLKSGAQDRRALQRGDFEFVMSKGHTFNDSIFSSVVDVKKGAVYLSFMNQFPTIISVLRVPSELLAPLTIVLPFTFLFAPDKFQEVQELLSSKGLLFSVQLDLCQY